LGGISELKRYRISEIDSALDLLGVATGDTVFVQSALVDFGVPADVALAALPEALYDVIRSKVGPQGTICVQSFSFGPCEGESFDAETTLGIGGSFAEHLRQRADSVRSRHPINSIAANGPNAAHICAPDTRSGYSSEGPYGRLLALDAKLLLMGRRNVETGSFAHYAEEQAQVPYRYWKSFPIRYKAGRHVAEREYDMYVRDLDLDPTVDLGPVCARFEESGIFRSAPVGGSDIRVASARELTEGIIALLRDDPWCLVVNGKGKSA
jgi:aminoglycoside N3'-acetyltransferase